MPVCLVMGERAQAWQIAVENLGEEWRCLMPGAETVRSLAGQVQLVIAGEEVLEQLAARPPIAPPWLISETLCPLADASLPMARVGDLPAMLENWAHRGCIPHLALDRHAQLTCLARGLLSTLTMPRRLRAWDFLPDMAALAAVHPPLMEDLRGRLYPLTARRHGMTPAAVERSLRLGIESTWSGASLGALERFFGHSVDPERGKPTNREFLFRIQERLTLAAGRLI